MDIQKPDSINPQALNDMASALEVVFENSKIFMPKNIHVADPKELAMYTTYHTVIAALEKAGYKFIK